MKGPWYETSGSFGLQFDLNQSLTFLGLSQLDGARFFFDLPYSDVDLFFGLYRSAQARPASQLGG